MTDSSTWGKITWTFFHTLAEKVDEDKFLEVKKNLIDIIFGICKNLPCPICANSATSILKQAYLNNIKTKQHFIEFLRQFHNIVNIKLSKPQFSRENLQNLYSKNNMNIVSDRFINIFKSKIFNINLITHSMHKDIYIKELIKNLNSIKNNIRL